MTTDGFDWCNNCGRSKRECDVLIDEKDAVCCILCHHFGSVSDLRQAHAAALRAVEKISEERDAARNEVADLHRQRRMQKKKRARTAAAKRQADENAAATAAELAACRAELARRGGSKERDPLQAELAVLEAVLDDDEDPS